MKSMRRKGSFTDLRVHRPAAVLLQRALEPHCHLEIILESAPAMVAQSVRIDFEDDGWEARGNACGRSISGCGPTTPHSTSSDSCREED